MKATIRDLKQSLSKPKNIAIGGASVCLFGTLTVLYGFMALRRFVVPFEILATAYIAWKIARNATQPTIHRVVASASVGLFIGGGLVLLAATLDSLLFPQPGVMTFCATVLLWAWIGFQMSRVDRRIAAMPKKERDMVSQSTELLIARINDQEIKSQQALHEYETITERFGFKNYISHVH